MMVFRRMLRTTPQFLAVLTLALALLWAVKVIPRVSYVSDVVALAAVVLAPGIVSEPLFHRGQWTLIERLGLAAALSIALTSLLGVGLHLVGLPVTPVNVLVLLLLVASIAFGFSFRIRSAGTTRRGTKAMRLEVAVGLASLALLAAGFAAIVVLQPAPEGPPLEVMILDKTGRLAAMPLPLNGERDTVEVLIRSASTDSRAFSVTINGGGLVRSSSSAILAETEWTSVDVPVEATVSGTILARLSVATDAEELTLPVVFELRE